MSTSPPDRDSNASGMSGISSSSQQQLSPRPAPTASSTAKVSLHLTVHNFTCRIGEDADLQIALYDGREQKFISENYLVNWGRQGFIKNVEQLDQLRVLFTVSPPSFHAGCCVSDRRYSARHRKQYSLHSLTYGCNANTGLG